MRVCVLTERHPAFTSAVKRLQIWTGHSGERLVDGRWLFLDLPFLPGDRLIAIPSISLWHTFSIKDNPKSNGAKIQNVICFAVPQGDSEPLHGESVSETVPEERAGHSTPTTAKTFTWAQIKFSCWWFLWKMRIELISCNVVSSVRVYFDFHVSDCFRHQWKILRNGDCLFIAGLLSFSKKKKRSSFSVKNPAFKLEEKISSACQVASENVFLLYSIAERKTSFSALFIFLYIVFF